MLLISCRKNAEEVILEPPPTPPLSRRIIGYAVVNAPFALIMAEPDQKSASRGYERSGSIVTVLERRLVQQEYWVYVAALEDSSSEDTLPRQGWIREEMIDIYGNRYQAETASRVYAP